MLNSDVHIQPGDARPQIPPTYGQRKEVPANWNPSEPSAQEEKEHSSSMTGLISYLI